EEPHGLLADPLGERPTDTEGDQVPDRRMPGDADPALEAVGHHLLDDGGPHRRAERRLHAKVGVAHLVVTVDVEGDPSSLGLGQPFETARFDRDRMADASRSGDRLVETGRDGLRDGRYPDGVEDAAGSVGTDRPATVLLDRTDTVGTAVGALGR